MASPEVEALVAKAVEQDPKAFGDGTILKWLIENGPQIIVLVKMVIEMFKSIPAPPTPTPTPGPGPIA